MPYVHRSDWRPRALDLGAGAGGIWRPIAGRERLGRSAEAKEAVAEPPERSRLLGRARQEALG